MFATVFAFINPRFKSSLTMPEMSQNPLLVVATLALAVAYLGYQLSDRNATIGLLNSDNAGLTLEKDQLILDLEKMRFSYDTLETENTMMLAELAAQQERIDGLLTKVKNGYWEVAKLKKEAETLRSIMKATSAPSTAQPVECGVAR